MTALTIPLTAGPQSFVIDLGGVQYRMTCKWCMPAACWTLDLADPDDVPLVNALALVPGVDVLGQHAHLGVAGRLFVEIPGEPDRTPGYADMGRTLGLYFVPA